MRTALCLLLLLTSSASRAYIPGCHDETGSIPAWLAFFAFMQPTTYRRKVPAPA